MSDLLSSSGAPQDAGPAGEISAPAPVPAGATGTTWIAASGLREAARWLILTAVWIVALYYMAHLLPRGWVPHDEGALGQSAERVLRGQLPHRDFDEIYTGGLSFLNAFAFRLLGVNLMSLRVVLFLFFLAWVPTVYYIASRFAGLLASAGITLLAVAWGVPNYAAPVPSWYNLFLATFGVAAVLRYLERQNRFWLFGAGLAGGFSLLAKISGIYYVAAILFFLVFLEQQQAAEAPGAVRRDRFSVYSGLLSALMAVFVLGNLLLILRGLGGLNYVFFFMAPSIALAVLLASREWRYAGGGSAQRIGRLTSLVWPFAFGMALPIGWFLIPYISGGSLAALFHGLFIAPAHRLASAAMGPWALSKAKWVLAPVALLGAVLYSRQGFRWPEGLALGGGLWYLLAETAESDKAYRATWGSAIALLPFVILAGVILLNAKRERRDFAALPEKRLMLLVAVTALWNLVQFPFAAPVYFCYVAPLLVLTVLALFSAAGRKESWILVPVAAFYLLFVVYRVTPGFIFQMGWAASPDTETQNLELFRAGGLRVNARDAKDYSDLISAVSAHAEGDFMYAAPDCPEVYFLAGLQNPTRTIFEFLGGADGQSPQVLRQIEAHGVNVIAINTQPSFSGPLPRDLLSALEQGFPHSRQIGRFEVRWRE